MFLPLKKGSSKYSLEELNLSGQDGKTNGLPDQRGGGRKSVGMSRNCGQVAWNVLASRPQGRREPSAESGMLGWNMRAAF